MRHGVERMTRLTVSRPAFAERGPPGARAPARRVGVRRAILAAVAAALVGGACTSTEVTAPPSTSAPSTAPVASVTVSPSADTLLAGDSQQLIAVPKDARGRALPGREVSWVSLNPDAASVSPTGLVSGRAAGSAQIVASSEGQTGTSTITVWPITRLTWHGAVSEYGINTVFLEHYWNGGAPRAQERYFDNFVVSTQRIGC